MIRKNQLYFLFFNNFLAPTDKSSVVVRSKNKRKYKTDNRHLVVFPFISRGAMRAKNNFSKNSMKIVAVLPILPFKKQYQKIR